MVLRKRHRPAVRVYLPLYRPQHHLRLRQAPYSLFVAINTIPAGLLCITQGYGGNWIYGLIWWAWGILWLTAFIEINLKKPLGKFVGYLGVVEGIVTAWIPGFLMLVGMWPA